MSTTVPRPEAAGLLRRAAELAEAREPYAIATVVWARRPTSAKPGDRAIVAADGRLEGWIGGGCSEPAVVQECLRALEEGTARLVHLGPFEALPEPREGMVVRPIGCASEGSLEVFVEPHTPRAHLVVIGDAPVAQTLAELASPLGFDVERIEAGDDGSVQLAGPTEIGPDSFIVAATLGQYDEAALEAALATDARYVALVGSRKRAAAVLATLRERGVPDGKLARVRAPAGLDLGRIEHREIAVAILAEIVKLRAALRRHGLDVGGDPDLFGRQHPASGPTVDRSETGGSGDVRSLPTDDISGAGDGPGAQAGPGADGHSAADGRTGAASGDAIDPVCGMTVDTATARFTAERDDRVFYFCCDGCRRRFESEPERYLAAGR